MKVIAFDADDTMWHHEPLFQMTQKKFIELLSKYSDENAIQSKLDAAVLKDLKTYGYGIKSFVLSMVEAATQLTNGLITGKEIQTIIDFGREMLSAPIELLDGVKETITLLSQNHFLMIITKGDLFDQETKIACSGIADYFDHVEILSYKDSSAYKSILNKYKIEPENFMMVGNSLKSDVLPVVEIGGIGVHIPYYVSAFHEIIPESEIDHYEFYSLDNIAQLPVLIGDLPNSFDG